MPGLANKAYAGPSYGALDVRSRCYITEPKTCPVAHHERHHDGKSIFRQGGARKRTAPRRTKCSTPRRDT